MPALVRYLAADGPRVGILNGGDVSATRLTDDAWSHALERLVEGGELCPTGQPLGNVKLLPPITEASRVYCVAQNYPAHAAEAGGDSPPTPIIFIKPPSCFVGDADEAVIPSISTFFDYEGEIAVVIGRTARNVRAEEAFDHIAGYTIGNDGSARDLQPATLAGRIQIDWFAAKSSDRGSALGPGVVPRTDVPEIATARITTKHNGDLVQDDVAGSMFHSIPNLVAFASSIVTLQPGDLILTGTPAGVGKARGVSLADGDSVVVSVTGLGALRTRYSAISN